MNKIIKMLSKKQLEKLSKAELIDYAINIGDIKVTIEEIEKKVSERFDHLEVEIDEKIEAKLSEFKREAKSRFEKVESELAICKNANQLLKTAVDTKNKESSKGIVNLERLAYSTAEYVNYETIEISKIPLTIPANEIETVALKIINRLQPEGEENLIAPEHVHACHRRQGKFTKEKVICKLVWRGDAQQILKRRSLFKDIDPTSIDERLTYPIFINEFLSPYYSKLRYVCKKLWTAKLIYNFWVSGHKHDNYMIIGHVEDLKDLFPDIDISQYLNDM